MINKESIHMMKDGVILDMAEHEKGQWEVCAK